MRAAAAGHPEPPVAGKPGVGRLAHRAVLCTVVSIGVSFPLHPAPLADPPTRVASATASATSETRSRLEPKLDGSIAGLLRARLTSGFNLAVQQVQEVESCSLLFASLRRDGLEMLRSTRYSLAGAAIVTDVCRKPNVVALTAVGSPATRVCPGFQRLTPEAAALVILHEALHYAGLRESPVHPDGPRPGQINAMVRKSCGL